MKYIMLVVKFIVEKWNIVLYCLIVFLIIALIVLLFLNVFLKSRLDACTAENTIIKQEIKHMQEMQELKVSHANKTIEKNIIEYKDKIIYIDRIQKDETKSDCDNALALLRANF